MLRASGLMRLAEGHGVAHEDFLKNYQGSELDPRSQRRTGTIAPGNIVPAIVVAMLAMDLKERVLTNSRGGRNL
jgi:hypothetical protein